MSKDVLGDSTPGPSASEPENRPGMRAAGEYQVGYGRPPLQRSSSPAAPETPKVAQRARKVWKHLLQRHWKNL
jgi:hypothetical protein